MTANVTLTNYLLLKRANTSVSSTYTGLVGEITIDTDLDTVRVHDGVTAGGHILANVNQINDSGNLSSLNANVSAANVQIDSLRANITAANVQITTLIANAAAQQVQINNFTANTGFATVDQLAANINIVNANVGAFQIFSNANAGTQATSINNLNANIGAYQTFANANVVAIQANLGAYQTYANTNTGSLQANLGAYQTYANANAAIQANELNNLSANAGVQATSINLLNANVTAANSAITTLTANAATQAGLITTVNANVTAANAAIASLQSNAAVQQGVLDVLSGNAVTQTLELQQLTSNAAVQAANLTVLLANAASQESSLTVLVSNAAAQSTAIDNINSNVGAYQIYANANAAAQATSITTLLSNAAAQALSLDSLTTNAATQGASIINLDANLGTATTNITALQANAGTQGAAIDSINANVGAYQTFANANAAVQANSLTTLIANAATQAQSLDSLTSNAATQAASINTIDANLGTATTNITSLQSNAGSQAAAIDSINANVGAYQTYANANAGAQAASISSLTANAAAQQLQIDSFVTGTGFALLTQLTANVNTINANVGAYQTYANANAAGQTTEINSLRANITAANTLIPNLSAVSGNILPSANVTYSLGDATHQWKDLWVSNNTIYIGNTPIRVDGGTLLVNNSPIAGGASANLVNGASTFRLFANGQSQSPDTIFAANGVSIINANGSIQGGMYNSGDADFFNIGASNGRGIKFYVNEETNGPQFFANGNIQVPGSIINGTGQINFVANSSGDGYGFSTIELRPDTNAYDDSYLIIDPTYPSHIHIRAGGAQDNSLTELYLGGENSHFKVNNGLNPDVSIAANNYVWLFGTDGSLTFPTGGNVIFDSSSTSIIDGVTDINAVGTIGANVIQVLSDLTSFGASPAPRIYGFSSMATTGSAVNEGNISASGNLVASQGAYVSGNVFAARYNFANGVNILSTVGAGSYGNTEVAAYLLTYSNANFATLNTTSANITTVRAANFNTANAVITGGYATGLANISVTGNATVGNLIGTSSNTTIVAGNYSSTFDTVGNVVLPSAFVSGNATVMGIAPGYAPNRPAFRIYGSSSNNWTTSNINFKGSDIVVDYNQGNYFNSTTGVFTAPVAGLYSITLNARIGNNNGQNQIMVLKNGLTSTGNVAVMWECDTNTGTAVHYGVSSVMKLVAGDFLTANITVGNIQFDANDSWTVTYLG